jgi:hypothetical protein
MFSIKQKYNFVNINSGNMNFLFYSISQIVIGSMIIETNIAAPVCSLVEYVPYMFW